MPSTGIPGFPTVVTIGDRNYSQQEAIQSNDARHIFRLRDNANGQNMVAHCFRNHSPNISQIMKKACHLLHLDHENVVRYYFVGVMQPDWLGVIAEHCNMPNLSHYEERLAVFEALQIGRSILEGLAYLHSNGVVHGELTTDSILLFPSERDSFPLPKISLVECLEKENVPQNLLQDICGKIEENGNLQYSSANRNYKSENGKEFSKLDIWSFGELMIHILEKVPTEDMKAEREASANPYYTQDTLPRLVKDNAALQRLSSKTPPGIYDLLHLCFRSHPSNRPTAQVLKGHYIFAADASVEKKEIECRRRIQQYLGSEYYYCIFDAANAFFYTKFLRLERRTQQVTTRIITVDHAREQTGNTLIWENIYDCSLDPHAYPSDFVFLEELRTFNEKDVKQLTHIRHQSILPLLECHYRYVADYVSVVYKLAYDPDCCCLQRLLEAGVEFSWNCIRTYIRQLIEGLVFLEQKQTRISMTQHCGVVLCERHPTGTFLRAKIHAAYFLDSMLDIKFQTHKMSEVDLMPHTEFARFMPPEHANLPSLAMALTASEPQQVWGIGHILLMLAMGPYLRFEKTTEDGCNESRVVDGKVPTEEIVDLLRSGWLPYVPNALPPNAKNIIKSCFLPQDERPSLESLLCSQLFQVAMPMEVVLQSNTKPVFTMRPVTEDELRAFEQWKRNPATNGTEIKPCILAASTAASIRKIMWSYRNLDTDRPIAVHLRTAAPFENLNALTAVSDLVLDLTVENVPQFNCNLLSTISLPNLLSLRIMNCSDIVLRPGVLTAFPKLRCLELPRCTLAEFSEAVLVQLTQLEMLTFSDGLAEDGTFANAFTTKICMAEEYAWLKEYLRTHSGLVQPRGEGDIWRYRSVWSRPNLGFSFSSSGNDCSPVNQMKVAKCIQVGLFGEFRIPPNSDQSADVPILNKIIQTDRLHPEYLEAVKMMCDLNHPNILAIHLAEASSIGGTLILSMDYLQAGSLGDHPFKYEVSQKLPTIVNFSKEILFGLQYLHKMNITHGSLHPWNVMLQPVAGTTHFKPKLSDYDNNPQRVFRTDKDRCNLISMCAERYISPEMKRGFSELDLNNLNTSADVWSFGQIILFLFLNRQAYLQQESSTGEFYNWESNALFSREDHKTWSPMPPPCMPPAFLDVLYLTFEDSPCNRPSADTLLHHYIYVAPHSMDSEPSRLIRTDIKSALTTFSCPPSLEIGPLERESFNSCAVFSQITKEWTNAPLLDLERASIRLEIPNLMQSVTFSHPCVTQLINMHIETSQTLRFAASFLSERDDINLTWHLNQFKISWTEIRSYCLDILSGLQYLAEKNIICDPIAIHSIRLCNKHTCGIYQRAKLFAILPVLSSLDADDRLRLLGKYYSYWYAPEEIAGYTKDFVHRTNIWHFGHTLLDMTTIISEERYVAEPGCLADTMGRPINGVHIPYYSDPLPWLRNQYKPWIPSYLPDRLQSVIRQCFQEAALRPTAAQLKGADNPNESLFLCSHAIPRKFLHSHVLPEFSIRPMSSRELVKMRTGNILLSNPDTTEPSEMVKYLWWTVVPTDLLAGPFLLLKLRNLDRDIPMAITITSSVLLDQQFFAPISDVLLELIIADIPEFNCEALQGLRLCNVLTLRFENCFKVKISTNHLIGFIRLMSLEFHNSTISDFEIISGNHLSSLYNLDLTGNTNWPEIVDKDIIDTLREYVERLLVHDAFTAIRALIESRRYLIIKKQSGKVWRYGSEKESSPNLGHLDFLL
ncbi:uncharacterized protein LOC129600953 [Paramacrobiotus metropolitanus]|uniref:uncharacterized protein LOC129600953 n=1 Tax=Paramacrobiotus metropolitanus TaxID=2943436 RepID=UPI002445C81F|nr:uncharacterized protein LOC129600953 [Paramacrobiotus metropolitanus]XP_055355614.1 uncharacterized protein LOC129600953 [Paramacrobiotus metropolitanus]